MSPLPDLDRFLALVADFGLKPEVTRADHDNATTDVTFIVGLLPGERQPKVEGYSGFMTSFEFAADGQFSRVVLGE